MNRHIIMFIILFLGVWIGVFGSGWIVDEYKSTKAIYEACTAAINKSK